jgi:hypothetical protein
VSTLLRYAWAPVANLLWYIETIVMAIVMNAKPDEIKLITNLEYSS